MTDIANFTKTRSQEVIKFQIDDDVFEAVPAVGAQVLDQVMDVSDFGDLLTLDPTDATRSDMLSLMKANRQFTVRLFSFLDEVLVPDSAQRFAERLRSTTEPIDLEQARNVIQYLLEQYGARPTGPSSPSSNGHDGTGTSSTAGAQAAG